MTFLTTDDELHEYIKRVERQMEILKLSTIFTAEEKKQIQSCFDDLLSICNARLESEKILKHSFSKNNRQ